MDPRQRLLPSNRREERGRRGSFEKRRSAEMATGRWRRTVALRLPVARSAKRRSLAKQPRRTSKMANGLRRRERTRWLCQRSSCFLQDAADGRLPAVHRLVLHARMENQD